MRPRVFPAEDLAGHAATTLGEIASMRPRVFPAEDGGGERASAPQSSSFNEAAGIPRGRRSQGGREGRRQAASMRPRVFPAEDKRGRQPHPPGG